MAWRNWRGAQLVRIIENAAVKAVKDTGEIILRAAESEVPLDEGTLRNTGIVIMAPGGLPSGCVTFGGGSGTGFPIIPYALRWHQVSANFQHGRKRFYLRDPFNRLAKSTLESRLAERLGGVL
jgi:hypothetical protein